MATVLMEFDQVCDNCHLFLANGEVYENHEEVTERTLHRIVARHGKLIAWMVNDYHVECMANGEDCAHEVIGLCDICDHSPADGYWWGHKAALVYGGKVKVEGLDHPARQIAASWQSPGTVGSVLAGFASTGEADMDELFDDMQRVINHAGRFAATYTVADRDMDRLRELVIEALKEGK